MKGYQEVNLAWEFIEMLDYLTEEEATEELQALLETDYVEELESEIDEELAYDFEDVLADVMESILSLVETYQRNRQYS